MALFHSTSRFTIVLGVTLLLPHVPDFHISITSLHYWQLDARRVHVPFPLVLSSRRTSRLTTSNVPYHRFRTCNGLPLFSGWSPGSSHAGTRMCHRPSLRISPLTDYAVIHTGHTLHIVFLATYSAVTINDTMSLIPPICSICSSHLLLTCARSATSSFTPIVCDCSTELVFQSHTLLLETSPSWPCLEYSFASRSLSTLIWVAHTAMSRNSRTYHSITFLPSLYCAHRHYSVCLSVPHMTDASQFGGTLMPEFARIRSVCPSCPSPTVNLDFPLFCFLDSISCRIMKHFTILFILVTMGIVQALSSRIIFI